VSVLGLGALAVVASAVLLLLAYPPTDLHWIAWVALVPLLLAARSMSTAGAFVLGVVWNLAFAFCLIDGLPDGVRAHFDQPAWVAWGFSALVFTMNSCLHYGAALALYRELSRRFSAALPLLAGAAFAAAELARARLLDPVPLVVPTPVGLLSGSQAASELLQIASLTGQYGITFVVIAVNAALVEAILAARDSRRRTPAAVAAGVAVALVAAAWVHGASVLRATPGSEEAAVPVVVVQGNLDPGGAWEPAWEPEQQGRNLDTYLKLTLSSFELLEPALVFWPEGSLTFVLEDAPPYRSLIARVLSTVGSELIAGGPRSGGGDPPRVYNSAFLLAPSGDTLAHYDKQRLLPFAEFAPFEGIDLQRRSFGAFRYWLTGGESAPLPTRAGGAGVLICNEILLPQLAARRVAAGAAFLVTPANDGWLAGGWTPWPRWGRLMLGAARLRAIETRRPIVRVSTSGPSAVVDAWGRVHVRSEPGRAAVVIGAIRPRSDSTPYARIGDAFGLACAAAALLALMRSPRAYNPT
jgi:apolipoprotein N-acyltransferase